MEIFAQCKEGLGPLNPDYDFEFTQCFLNQILANLPRLAVLIWGIGRISIMLLYPSPPVATAWLYYLKSLAIVSFGVANVYTATADRSTALATASCVVVG